MRSFSWFARFDNPDDAAKDILKDIAAGRLDAAADKSLYFADRHGTAQPVAYVLCAAALEKNGYIARSLEYWDKAVQRCPEKLEWLKGALAIAWKHERKCAEAENYIQSWLKLMEYVYVSMPDAGFLENLAEHGWKGNGCLGIHKNRIRGWIWLPKNEKLALGMEPKNIISSLSLKTKALIRDHFLYEVDESLPEKASVITVSMTNGAQINGSPLICSPSALEARKNQSFLPRADITIIIPVYDGRKSALSCLGSIFASARRNKTSFNILAMWDHGPDARLLANLKKLDARGKIFLRQTPVNMGFLGCVNTALGLVRGGDVALLNSDTLVHGDWLDRLARAGKKADAATVTCLGSEAEHVSYPAFYDRGIVEDLSLTALIDGAARELDADGALCETPVGCGFCMLIARRALDLLGGLDGRMLCKGYGEEVEYCLRAKDKGLKNYVAANVFVAHVGGVSFGSAKRALAAQNNLAIFADYPDYRKEYDAFLLEDPLKKWRARISEKLLEKISRVDELHVLPWSNQFLPIWQKRNRSEKSKEGKIINKRNTRNSQCVLFVQRSRDKIKILARVWHEIPLCDVEFILPDKLGQLREILKNWKIGEVLHESARKILVETCSLLNLPEAGKTALDDAISADMGNIEGKKFLVAPAGAREWKAFCDFAKINEKTIFYCLGQRLSWPRVYFPKNARPVSRLDDMEFMQPDGMIFFGRANNTEVWRKWLEQSSCAAAPFYNVVANEI